MEPMTEKEIEEAVAHDMKILEEHWKEQGFEDSDDEQYVQRQVLDARLELVQAKVDARLDALRAELMRWTVLLFCAATLVAAILAKL